MRDLEIVFLLVRSKSFFTTGIDSNPRINPLRGIVRHKRIIRSELLSLLTCPINSFLKRLTSTHWVRLKISILFCRDYLRASTMYGGLNVVVGLVNICRGQALTVLVLRMPSRPQGSVRDRPCVRFVIRAAI